MFPRLIYRSQATENIKETPNLAVCKITCFKTVILSSANEESLQYVKVLWAPLDLFPFRKYSILISFFLFSVLWVFSPA